MNIEKLSENNVDEYENFLYSLETSLLYASNNFRNFTIFFNPPYVETDVSEYKTRDFPISRSWAGGKGGILPLHNFLLMVTNFEFKCGFFLTSNRNSNERLIERFSTDFVFTVVGRQLLPDEKLICYKFHKTDTNIY